MPHPTAAVIVFPGTNREQDAVLALERAGFKTQTVWHRDAALPAVDLVLLPGGFSYGDYLRTGAMAAKSPIMQDVVNHAKRGGKTIGICNGFQILCEAGLLPGVLLRNGHLKFTCKWVNLRVEQNDNIFARHYRPHQVIHVPTAHGDGNYFADDATLDTLEQNNQILFRYCDDRGEVRNEASINPNGSARNITGIINKAGNVMGMMPHPENAIDLIHGSTDGAGLFQSLFESVK